MALKIYFGVISLLLATISQSGGQLDAGGPVVSLEYYGFQAIVQIVVKSNIVKICGGTIVSAHHVLTTASCFSSSKNQFYDIQIRVGTVNVFKGGEIYNVSKVEQHPEFDAYISTHNLAIVFITNGIQFKSMEEVTQDGIHFVKQVNSLPLSHQFVIGGEKVTISGFTVNSLTAPENRLRTEYTYSQSYFPCLDYFRNSAVSVELIHDEVLCVRNNPAAGFCDILDGSPAVIDNKLVGLFLFSKGECTDDNIPLLFTRIANNALWLHTHINPDRFRGTGAMCTA